MLSTISASSLDSNLSLNSGASAGNSGNLLPVTPVQSAAEQKDCKGDAYNGLDFKLIVDSKSGPPLTITLVASTLHEKAAWCSDISQVLNILNSSHIVDTIANTTGIHYLIQDIFLDRY